MIKFFRRIRQRLVSENKFSKYLLYAIGEIILVVIGILIALQINTWNENRKERKLERSYLELLTQDLKSDAILLTELVSESNKSVVSKNIILAYQKGEISKPDSLSTHFLQAVFSGIASFVPNTGAINEVQNAGGLTLLKNEAVRNQILTLYNQYDQLEKNVGRYYLENSLAMRDLVYTKVKDNLFVTNEILEEKFIDKIIFDSEIRNRLINNWAVTYNSNLKQLVKINNETINVCKDYLQEFYD